jgi:hypothetical protein
MKNAVPSILMEHYATSLGVIVIAWLTFFALASITGLCKFRFLVNGCCPVSKYVLASGPSGIHDNILLSNRELRLYSPSSFNWRYFMKLCTLGFYVISFNSLARVLSGNEPETLTPLPAFRLSNFTTPSEHLTNFKSAAFWNVAPYGSSKSRRFGGTCRLQLQGGINNWARKSVRLC